MRCATSCRRARRLAGLAALLIALAAAASASAAITPSVTLDQSAGTQAAATANLGVDLTFAVTGSDSVKDLTLAMAPGLLASASIDNGACLTTSVPLSACQVGTGTATPYGAAAAALPASFDLVAPPSPGDLAGLQLLLNGSPLGSPADITVRPGSSPDGVGLDIAFHDIPDTYLGVPIQVTSLDSTFDGLRYPSRCPATPATVQVSTDSYESAATATAGAPLSVTGCAHVPYAPRYTLSATEDSGDEGVTITTKITQAAGEATSSEISLGFPVASLYANVYGVGDNSVLCADPASGTCKTIGSATAVSPEYPTPLVGSAYLTGASLLAPDLTLVFPAPFALTLTGSVAVSDNQTTFTGIPDIPLTSLQVVLNGGPESVYDGSCRHPTGTATAAFTDQNGDPPFDVSSPFTIAGCPTVISSRPRITAASISGLRSGRPVLRFRVSAGSGDGRLRSLTITLPRGLRFISRARRSRARPVARFTLTLRNPGTAVSIRVGAAALRESRALEKLAGHHRLKSLRLTVSVRQNKVTKLSTTIRNLHL
jgi:hypothetical protein